VIDGKTYAQINSLTNSMYSVIWHQATFSDIGGHWAGNIIGNLGNRLVLNGYEDGNFRPDQPITRAEFAAYMVRGLGLHGQQGAESFTDVSADDWYHDVAGTASAYGLIRGFADGRFAGSDRITREQAMVIIARAMALTGLQGAAADAPEHEILRSFTDAARVSEWARRDVATSVRAGIVFGKDHGGLAPQDLLSRAEAAVLIYRLLVQSGLIDE
jgi:roadblock/LC7 domain-containing protein